MSTQKYINSNWPGLQEKVKLEQVDSGLEIDVDIEKQIVNWDKTKQKKNNKLSPYKFK